MRYRSGRHNWEHLTPVGRWDAKALKVYQTEGRPWSPYTTEQIKNIVRDEGSDIGIAQEILRRMEGKTCKPLRHHRLLECTASETISLDIGEQDSLRLYLDETDYMMFLATNKEAEGDGKYREGLERNGKFLYGNEMFFFSNILGNTAVVRTDDGRYIVGQRPGPEKTHDYPGGMDMASGHSEVDKHGFTGEGQFEGMKMELEEETPARREDIKSIHVTGITRDLRTLKPVLNFSVQLGVGSEELGKRCQGQEFERLLYISEDEVVRAVVENRLLPAAQGGVVAEFYLRGTPIRMKT